MALCPPIGPGGVALVVRAIRRSFRPLNSSQPPAQYGPSRREWAGVCVTRRTLLKDQDFLADMAKPQLPVHPLTGEEAEAIVAKMMNAPPE